MTMMNCAHVNNSDIVVLRECQENDGWIRRHPSGKSVFLSMWRKINARCHTAG
jgi:hypothetical protein